MSRMDEIRERLEKATETITSHWVCYDGWGPPSGKDRMRCASVSNGRENVIHAIGKDGREAELIAREDDLLLICYAPSDLRYLLDRVERLEEVLVYALRIDPKSGERGLRLVKRRARRALHPEEDA